jgi:hypothetical protein
MHIRFGALDVVVKIVPEDLDTRDGFFPSITTLEMLREEDYSKRKLVRQILIHAYILGLPKVT